MDIAFHSIVVLILVIFPGALFRRIFYRGEFSKQYDSQSWYHTFFISSVWGVFLHLLTIFTIYYSFKDLPATFLSDGMSYFTDAAFETSFFGRYGLSEFVFLIKYAGILIGITLSLALLFFWMIRAFRLDLKTSIFRFSNHWHYYFKGEILNTSDFQHLSRRGKVIDTVVDAVVKTTEKQTLLYTGYLKQHSINKTSGQLENIYLTDTKLIKKKKDTEGKPIRRVIPGDVFVIPYNFIVNLNLTYIIKLDSPKNYRPLLSFILISGYILIWFDFWNLLIEMSLWSKFSAKILLHVFYWALCSYIFAKRYRERNDLDAAQVIAPGTIAIVAIVLLILLFVAYSFSSIIS